MHCELIVIIGGKIGRTLKDDDLRVRSHIFNAPVVCKLALFCWGSRRASHSGFVRLNIFTAPAARKNIVSQK